MNALRWTAGACEFRPLFACPGVSKPALSGRGSGVILRGVSYPASCSMVGQSHLGTPVCRGVPHSKMPIPCPPPIPPPIEIESPHHWLDRAATNTLRGDYREALELVDPQAASPLSLILGNGFRRWGREHTRQLLLARSFRARKLGGRKSRQCCRRVSCL